MNKLIGEVYTLDKVNQIKFNKFKQEFTQYNKGDFLSDTGFRALFNWLQQNIPYYILDVPELVSFSIKEYANIDELRIDYEDSSCSIEELVWNNATVIMIDNVSFIVMYP